MCYVPFNYKCYYKYVKLIEIALRLGLLVQYILGMLRKKEVEFSESY